LHFCLTCYGAHQDDNVFRNFNKRLVVCVKCPTAYHNIHSCIAAGSHFIDQTHIICPEHPEKSSQGQSINVTWCFSCNINGNLLCCEKCPTAIHKECIEYNLPEGRFVCINCIKRKQLLYNDIVWVKLGSYRWWPGQIKHPSDVPLNIQQRQHDIGDFPVRFFGSHDYFWVNKGRAFLYMNGDEKRTCNSKKLLDKTFVKAMEEVTDEFIRLTSSIVLSPQPASTLNGLTLTYSRRLKR